MQTLTNSTRGLGLLVALNWDRLMFLVIISLAMCLGAWLATLT